VEGLSFSVLKSVNTKGRHLCIYVDYINRNTLFSFNYMLKTFVLFSMGKVSIHVDGLY